MLWVMPSKEGGDDATHTHNKEADFSLSLTHTSCTTLNKNNNYLGRTLPCRCISRQGLPAAAFYINSVSTAGPCSIASLPLQPPRSTTLAPSETICTAINVESLWWSSGPTADHLTASAAEPIRQKVEVSGTYYYIHA